MNLLTIGGGVAIGFVLLFTWAGLERSARRAAEAELASCRVEIHNREVRDDSDDRARRVDDPARELRERWFR